MSSNTNNDKGTIYKYVEIFGTKLQTVLTGAKNQDSNKRSSSNLNSSGQVSHRSNSNGSRGSFGGGSNDFSSTHTGTSSCGCGGNCYPFGRPNTSNYVNGNISVSNTRGTGNSNERRHYDQKNNSSIDNTQLPDNVILMKCGRYQMLDSGLKLSKEEYIFVMDHTVVQDKSTTTSTLDACLHKSGTNVSTSASSSNERQIKFHKSGTNVSTSASSSNARQIKFRNNPTSPQEKTLECFTTEIVKYSLPTVSSTDSGKFGGALGAVGGASGISSNNAENVDDNSTDCSICMSSLAEESPYQTEEAVSRDLVGNVSLVRCRHEYHTSCVLQLLATQSSSFSCPNCHSIHGVRTGTQPVGGEMKVSHPMNMSLPGHRGSGTFKIQYSFPPGVQGPEHPNPGRPYNLIGFPRVAYIPDTSEGKKVISLLQVAFDRRLVFTVATSSSTGISDCVVWNDIHHKTEMHNTYGHGYPDPKYLDNVTMELASFGVTEP